MLLSIGLWTVGCGGNGAATVHLEDASACASTWQRLTTPQPFDSTSALVYAGGTLYYSSYGAQAVMTVPTDGSAPSVLAAVPAWELWLEGSHLLFSGASPSNQIVSLPLTAGTPQLMLDGGAGRSSPGLATVHVFTATDFFWIEQAGVDGTASPSTVWHQARSGGAPERLATTTFTDPSGLYFPGTALALGSTAVVVGSAFGEAAAVPVGGGGSTPLATPAATANLDVQSFLAGIDANGVYWSVPDAGNQPASLMLSPADGSAAKQFGPTLPGNRSSGLVQRI